MKVLRWKEIANVISEPFPEDETGLKEAKELAKSLIAICKKKNGLGIAAPQIGVYKELFVYRRTPSDRAFTVVMNPKCIPTTTLKISTNESCFSVPERSFFIERHNEILAEYIDPYTGQKQERTIAGLEAVVFQHECDHLIGVSIAQLASEEKE